MRGTEKRGSEAITWEPGEDGHVGRIRERSDLRVEANAYRWRIVEVATKRVLIERMVDDHAIQRANRKAGRGKGTSRIEFGKARCSSWVAENLGIRDEDFVDDES